MKRNVAHRKINGLTMQRQGRLMMTYIGYTKLCKVNYCVCVIEIYINHC